MKTKQKFYNMGQSVAEEFSRSIASHEGVVDEVTNAILSDWKENLDQLWDIVGTLSKFKVHIEHQICVNELQTELSKSQIDWLLVNQIILYIVALRTYNKILDNGSSGNLEAVSKLIISKN